MLRKRFGERQVGHGGTLDPDATGVLVVAVGMATKLLRFVEKTTKAYVGEVVLGTETDTLDAAGEVTATHDMAGVTIDDARASSPSTSTGDIEQIPPMVSAIKVDGRRLHELAREGIEVERPPRPVTIHSFDVEPSRRPGVFAIDVECSPGTYIRTLAADLGHLLGGGAHLRNSAPHGGRAFTLDEAGPPTSANCSRSATRSRLAGSTSTTRPPRSSPTGGCSPRWDGDGPWAVFDAAASCSPSTSRSAARRSRRSCSRRRRR